jgi:hypothetical protein
MLLLCCVLLWLCTVELSIGQVNKASVPRNSAADPLGVQVVLPDQIDLVYHEVELRVSEAFVFIDSVQDNSPLKQHGRC